MSDKKAIKTIAICTPIRPHGTIPWWWHGIVEGLLVPNCYVKQSFGARDKEGGNVDLTRNELVQNVLDWDLTVANGGVTHLMWVDDDVLAYDPRVIIRLWERATELRAAVVSGTYFFKDGQNRPLIFDGPNDGSVSFVPDECRQRWGCGSGLTLVHKDVYRATRDRLQLPKDRRGNVEWYRTTFLDQECMRVEDGVLQMGDTEDFHFYNHVRKLGGKIYVDTSEAAFGFHYDCQKDQGWPTEQWAQWMNKEPLSWRHSGNKLTTWEDGKSVTVDVSEQAPCVI